MNRFDAITRSMINTVHRTGRSTVLSTSRDCSCCLLTETGDLLVMAESAPMHVVSGPDLMAKAMMRFHPDLRRGDAFLHNSPYHGNAHAADHSILVPVIDDDGVHHFTVFVKGHMADCGSSQPTTYFATPRDVYEEGSPIFPAVQIQRGYEDIDDIVRMCELRIRVPEQWKGDYYALLGGARIGERSILELGRELGWDALHGCAAEWFNYSERRMINAINKLPSGRITVSGFHDPFPGVPDGVPLSVTVETKSDEAVIEVDLRDNPDCVPCGLNLTEASTRAAVMTGIHNSIEPSIPTNEGSARRLRIQLRENCCVGIPRHPASCAAATTNLADRITNLIQRALAELGDGIGMAEAGPILPPGGAVISGSDPRAGGAPFVNQIFLGLTGGAGSPNSDGWLTLTSVGAGGMSFRDSVEIDELRFPIRVYEQRIVADSGGAGRFRGAPSGYVEYGPLDCTLEIIYASDGSVYPAEGVRGGRQGKPAEQHKRDSDGALSPLEGCARIVLQPGESIVSVFAGGGGYGDPFEREPERVAKDVAHGFVTREGAFRDYGVAVTSEYAVDHDGTTKARAGQGNDA
jgi:N-methylhydantoinase B